MSATNLNIRTDKDVKEQAEQTAIRKHGIPFDLYLDVPNETTVAAIEEGKKLLNDPSSPKYSSMEELKAALES